MPEVERPLHPMETTTTTREEASPQLKRSSESHDSTKEGLSVATGEELLVPLYLSRTLHNTSPQLKWSPESTAATLEEP